MILNHFLEVYLLLCVSIVIHELAHYLAARVIKLDVNEIHIGDKLFSIHINKLYFSPFMYTSAYVSFYVEDLLEKSVKEIIFFFLAGPISNLLLIFFSLLKMNCWYMNVLFWINVYLLVENMLPFFYITDVGKIFKYIQQKNRSKDTGAVMF